MTTATLHSTTGIGCAILKDPDNGLVLLTGKDIGSTGNYSCEQGFTLSGNVTIVCIDHGEWSGQEPTCNGISTQIFHNIGIIISCCLFPSHRIS